MNPLALLILGGGAVWLYKLHEAGGRLSITVTKAGVKGVSEGALHVWADVAIDNPTATALAIQKPNLTVFIGQTQVGNSIPSDETISIEPRKRTVIGKMNVQIPLLNIPGGLSAFLGGGKFGIEVRTEANGIPYKDFKTFSA